MEEIKKFIVFTIVAIFISASFITLFCINEEVGAIIASIFSGMVIVGISDMITEWLMKK